MLRGGGGGVDEVFRPGINRRGRTTTSGGRTVSWRRGAFASTRSLGRGCGRIRRSCNGSFGGNGSRSRAWWGLGLGLVWFGLVGIGRCGLGEGEGRGFIIEKDGLCDSGICRRSVSNRCCAEAHCGREGELCTKKKARVWMGDL